VSARKQSGAIGAAVRVLLWQVHSRTMTSPSSESRHTAPVALVTGAGKRLGRGIALALAQQGWNIGVHYATSAAEATETVSAIEALGRRALALQADLADETQVLALLPTLSAALGPVQALVNNASRFVFDEAADFSQASFNAHMLPNLAAPVLLARELHRLLSDRPGLPQPAGVVVNLLDQKLYGYNPDFLSYSLTKAGLDAANTMLAQALAPRVRVVGVAPGLTLPSYLLEGDEFARAHAQHSPLGRCSDPEDVIAAVCFAIANRSMTGSVIVVDGGQHIRPLPRDVSLMPAAQPTPSPPEPLGQAVAPAPGQHADDDRHAAASPPTQMPLQCNTTASSSDRNASAFQTAFVRGLRLDAQIGVFDHEKGRTQPLEVDLEVRVNAARFAPQHDRLEEVFDYQALRAVALDVAQGGHIQLLETFAARVLDRVLALPDVLGARLRVSKFTAFEDCTAVGVLVERGMT
jgi:dihydroneopterin aldolase